MPMELSLDTLAEPWLMWLGLRSGWTAMPDRKIDWLMGLGLRSRYTHVSARKIDWLIGLESKSKYDVPAEKSGNQESGTSRNSWIILSTSFRISSQMSISFSCTDF